MPRVHAHLYEPEPIRWALDAEGSVVDVEVGSCSDGFGRLEPALPEVVSTRVGKSHWLVLSAKNALELLTQEIMESPNVTKCTDPGCDRCRDAVAGGPIM